MTATPLSRRIHSLSTVSALWLDHANPWRQKAGEALAVSTGHSPLLVDEALDAVFGEITSSALEAFCHESISDDQEGESKIVLHIAAGNVFTAWLHGAVITLLLGHDCWLKPSSLEPIFGMLWQSSLRIVDAPLAEHCRLVPWSDGLPDQVDAAIAYGSDATLATLRPRFAQKIFIGYGHRWSLAIITAGALRPSEWPQWKDRLLRDSRAFGLQGCLSPQRVFVQGTFPDRSFESLSPSGAPRIEHFHSCNEIRDRLGERLESISCIGIAGSPQDLTQAEQTFAHREKIRYAYVGTMQRPPLTWRNGGLSLVDELAPLMRPTRVSHG
jgi:hypothetical protein